MLTLGSHPTIARHVRVTYTRTQAEVAAYTHVYRRSHTTLTPYTHTPAMLTLGTPSHSAYIHVYTDTQPTLTRHLHLGLRSLSLHSYSAYAHI